MIMKDIRFYKENIIHENNLEKLRKIIYFLPNKLISLEKRFSMNRQFILDKDLDIKLLKNIDLIFKGKRRYSSSISDCKLIGLNKKTGNKVFFRGTHIYSIDLYIFKKYIKVFDYFKIRLIIDGFEYNSLKSYLKLI